MEPHLELKHLHKTFLTLHLNKKKRFFTRRKKEKNEDLVDFFSFSRLSEFTEMSESCSVSQ